MAAFSRRFDILKSKYHVYQEIVRKELHDLLHLYSQNDKAYQTLVASKEKLIVSKQPDAEHLGRKSDFLSQRLQSPTRASKCKRSFQTPRQLERAKPQQTNLEHQNIFMMQNKIMTGRRQK